VAVRYLLHSGTVSCGRKWRGKCRGLCIKTSLPEGGRDIGICPLGRGEYKKGKEREKVGKCIEKKKTVERKRENVMLKG
jgi:hypothetical protein